MSDHCNCSWKRVEALLGFLFEFFSNPAWLSMGARCIRINSRELAPLLSHSVRIFATESGDILHGSICNCFLCLQLEHVFSRHLSSSSTRANTTLRCVQACVSAGLHYLLTISLVCFFGAGLTCCFFFFPKIGCAPGIWHAGEFKLVAMLSFTVYWQILFVCFLGLVWHVVFSLSTRWVVLHVFSR